MQAIKHTIRIIGHARHQLGLFMGSWWFRISVIGVLLFVLFKKDVNFSFSFGGGNADAVQASLLMPISSSNEPEHEEVHKAAKPAPKTKIAAPKKPTVLAASVANPATAVSKAFTAKEKDAAVSISNLAVLLNPDYIKRNNVPKSVVDQKMQICRQYVNKYYAAAKREAREKGIPASITLAQGLLETNAGESLLAVKANNHFGMKCFSRTCRKGHCMNATDDSHKDFFLIFKSIEDSYRMHSEFLLKQRYQHLLKLKRTDYKGWAIGLSKAGYATDDSYGQKLIKIIEGLKLYMFDMM